jgi:hypothetical protein
MVTELEAKSNESEDRISDLYAFKETITLNFHLAKTNIKNSMDKIKEIEDSLNDLK